jgi:hypothetical protein
MGIQQNQTVLLYMVRVNGTLEEVFTNKTQAESYMELTRKNGQFWRIQEKRTVPHQG